MILRHLILGTVAAALFFAVAPRDAEAARVNGKTLLKFCTQEAESKERNICLGYIAAVADTLENEGVGKRKACFKKSDKFTALRLAVVAHLEKQKKTAEEPANSAVTIALVNKFSCR